MYAEGPSAQSGSPSLFWWHLPLRFVALPCPPPREYWSPSTRRRTCEQSGLLILWCSNSESFLHLRRSHSWDVSGRTVPVSTKVRRVWVPRILALELLFTEVALPGIQHNTTNRAVNVFGYNLIRLYRVGNPTTMLRRFRVK